VNDKEAGQNLKVTGAHIPADENDVFQTSAQWGSEYLNMAPNGYI
jgi:hypothetical protein